MEIKKHSKKQEEGKEKDRSCTFHSYIIHSMCTLAMRIKKDSSPSSSLHMINQTRHQSILLYKFMIIHDKLTHMQRHSSSNETAKNETESCHVKPKTIKQRQSRHFCFTWNMSGVVAEEKLRLLPMWVSGSYFDIQLLMITVLAVPCSPISKTAQEKVQIYDTLIHQGSFM